MPPLMGLQGLIGQNVTLFCLAHVYTGKLTGVDLVEATLEDATITTDDTHKFSETEPHTNYLEHLEHLWATTHALGSVWYIPLPLIESYGVLE